MPRCIECGYELAEQDVECPVCGEQYPDSEAQKSDDQLVEDDDRGDSSISDEEPSDDDEESGPYSTTNYEAPKRVEDYIINRIILGLLLGFVVGVLTIPISSVLLPINIDPAPGFSISGPGSSLALMIFFLAGTAGFLIGYYKPFEDVKGMFIIGGKWSVAIYFVIYSLAFASVYVSTFLKGYFEDQLSGPTSGNGMNLAQGDPRLAQSRGEEVLSSPEFIFLVGISLTLLLIGAYLLGRRHVKDT